MPNRRNVLVGLGGLVAGGGALIGTGAFDTVEAERTVSVETAGDANAFLGLAPADNDPESGFVTVGGDDTIEIVLNETTQGGQGLNQRAVTTFTELVTITNQGTQDVASINLTLAYDGAGTDPTDAFAYPVNSGTEVDNGSDILTEVDDSPLSPGETVTFGMEVDLLSDDNPEALPEGNYTLTIEANTP